MNECMNGTLTSSFLLCIVRRKSHKTMVSHDEGRRNRMETSLQIRKERREDKMMARRRRCEAPNVLAVVSSDSSDSLGSCTLVPSDRSIVNEPTSFSPTSSSSAVGDLISVYTQFMINEQSVTVENLYETTKNFRRLLSVTDRPPVKEIIQVGAVEVFVKLLTHPDQTIIFEALWALTNIASTKYAATVATSGAVDIIATTGLLVHENPDIREQAAWCIGNIAGDNIKYRDELLGRQEIIHGM